MQQDYKGIAQFWISDIAIHEGKEAVDKAKDILSSIHPKFAGEDELDWLWRYDYAKIERANKRWMNQWKKSFKRLCRWTFTRGMSRKRMWNDPHNNDPHNKVF